MLAILPINMKFVGQKISFRPGLIDTNVMLENVAYLYSKYKL